MVVLHFLALFLLSLVPDKQVPSRELTEFLVGADNLRRLLLEGDALAAEELLGRLIGASTGIKSQSQLEELLPGGIARLIPGFSAITFADRLLSLDPGARRKESARFVEGGHFRKFGVTGKVAPKLLQAALQWMEGEEPGALRDEVARERKGLSRETERLLRPLLRPR